MKILIKNAQLIDAVVDYPMNCDLLIVDGVIEQISTDIQCAADKTIAAQGLTVLPGLVDMHVHLREPGFEHKETVATGSRAAAKGGYTTICCMPNTKPVIDNAETLSMLINIIQKDAVVNVLPIAAVSLEQKSQALTDMPALAQLGAIAFSDDGQPVSDKELMNKALFLSKQHQLLVIDHCEDHTLVHGGVINEGEKADVLGLPGISNLSEELPVMRDIMLAGEADYKIHIAHVSTSGSAEIIRLAKQRGVQVTCEVTPHHIALSDDIIAKGFTDCKVNPPLRSKEDVAAMKQALADGTIDVIATDHAPHHQDDKGEDFFKAANGISGIETAFSVCYTELVDSGLMTLKELVHKMSFRPSQILGINKGRLAVGAIADLTIVDLSKTVTINKNAFYSKGKNAPFHGRSYKGEVLYTIVNGEIVYSIGGSRDDN